jgi:hypothetical protein
MHKEHIAELLINGRSRCAAGEGERRVPPSPGFYAIFVDNACSLPAPFVQILRNQRTRPAKPCEHGAGIPLRIRVRGLGLGGGAGSLPAVGK